MEEAVISFLSKYDAGMACRKWHIADETGIPEDILTVILKRLKDKGKIKIARVFSEDTGLANGSGYALSFEYRGKLKIKQS